MITETDDVAIALDDAALRWPQDADNRPRLLRRLLEQGHRSVVADQAAAVLARQDAVQRSSGSMAGVYEPGYLDALHAEWPE